MSEDSFSKDLALFGVAVGETHHTWEGLCVSDSHLGKR